MPHVPTENLTPDQRFQQLAAILARGVRRHRQLRRRYESSAPPTELIASGLEVRGRNEAYCVSRPRSIPPRRTVNATIADLTPRSPEPQKGAR